MSKMEKYCPKCGKVYKGKEAKAKVCMFCAIPLKERESRIPFSDALRDKVFRRDGYRCVRCGASKDQKRLEVDHIVPISLGGTNDIGNLQTLCWECNRDKGTVVPDLGLKYDIEIKENELKTLNRLLQENKNKLNTAFGENEKIEYEFNIMQLEKDISSVNAELNELKIKYQKEQERIKKEKEENERKEFLFKKLVVKLSPVEKLILKEHYDLNNLSDEAMLKTITEEYSENEILRSIENYKNNLHQILENSLKFNMLPLLSSELSINGPSKNNIIDYLINNCTKSQIDDLINKVKAELFNQYAASFTNIEKSILKRHYSFNNISDAQLINYIIENDYSIDELKNTVNASYKSIFQEYYGQLDEYQKFLVIVRFENHGNNLVDFLANNNFSSRLLKDELEKTKIELYNKTMNSLNFNEKSLIERYGVIQGSNFNLIEFLYKNKFSQDKIDELVELSKKETINDIHQNLNNHEMFLLENFFENDNDLIIFMAEHAFSMNSLRKKLKRAHAKLYDDFDKNLNHDYEKILYDQFSLKTKSKDCLIEYLIYENYNVNSMNILIRDAVFIEFDNLFDKYSISQVCYELNLPNNKSDLYKYLFKERYTFYSTKQLIKRAEKNLMDKLKEKLDFRTVQLINKQLNLPNSKNNLISHLINNYTVESMSDLLKKYDIKF